MRKSSGGLGFNTTCNARLKLAETANSEADDMAKRCRLGPLYGTTAFLVYDRMLLRSAL